MHITPTITYSNANRYFRQISRLDDFWNADPCPARLRGFGYRGWSRILKIFDMATISGYLRILAAILIYIPKVTGWWLSHPSEKSVGWWHSQYMPNVPTHQPASVQPQKNSSWMTPTAKDSNQWFHRHRDRRLCKGHMLLQISAWKSLSWATIIGVIQGVYIYIYIRTLCYII